MVQSFIDFLTKVWNNQALRQKILFTALIIFVYRMLAHVPVPGVALGSIRTLFEGNQFLSLLNIFSGGTLANFSLAAVGINPYITASIVLQLGTMLLPKLKEIQKDGEAGREKINQYTRMLTVPLALVQSISVIALLRSQSLLTTSDPLTLITLLMSLVAGGMIVMWLGELISEHGIGNGISMVLFAGIVSQLPRLLVQVTTASQGNQALTVGLFAGLLLGLVAVVVFMNEAVRRVPIQYAKRQRGSRIYGGQMSHLPIKVNVAGVMPIIFALSIMMVPSFLSRLMVSSNITQVADIGRFLGYWMGNSSPVYLVVYFLTVFFFTYFSALVFFNAGDIADELKKSGAFIPGIRPGNPTKKHLEFVVSRVVLAGAVFLSGVAILPIIIQNVTGIASLAIGGTSVLIVVSVVLETAKQVESLLVEHNYDKYRK